MKKIIIVYLYIVVFVSFCNAQNSLHAYSDSIAQLSRKEADFVLSRFDKIYAKKIFYSFNNEYFLVIVQVDSSTYKEFRGNFKDSGNLVNIKEIDNRELERLRRKKILIKKQRAILDRLEDNTEIVKNAFDVSKYSTEFITNLPDTVVPLGHRYAYFVLQDENGNRYGEYSSYACVSPCPINLVLMIYLLKKALQIE